MLLQTNSYIVPKEKRAEHARLLRRFRSALAKLGCENFEVYEQVAANWAGSDANGRYVQIMRFRDKHHQMEVQQAERNDPLAQSLIREFCELINFPYQQQQGLFAVGYYTSALPVAPASSYGEADQSPNAGPPPPQARPDQVKAAPRSEHMTSPAVQAFLAGRPGAPMPAQAEQGPAESPIAPPEAEAIADEPERYLDEQSPSMPPQGATEAIQRVEGGAILTEMPPIGESAFAIDQPITFEAARMAEEPGGPIDAGAKDTHDLHSVFETRGIGETLDRALDAKGPDLHPHPDNGRPQAGEEATLGAQSSLGDEGALGEEISLDDDAALEALSDSDSETREIPFDELASDVFEEKNGKLRHPRANT